MNGCCDWKRCRNDGAIGYRKWWLCARHWGQFCRLTDDGASNADVVEQHIAGPTAREAEAMRREYAAILAAQAQKPPETGDATQVETQEVTDVRASGS